MAAISGSGSYWESVQATGLAVPSDRPLDELTAELTRMLGDADPEIRTGIAAATLVTWVGRGVYDDLLAGLGDGMAAGLRAGLSDAGSSMSGTVLRRSWSAVVLAACLDRDNERSLVPAGKVLEWGDRLATWLVRERDLRTEVPGSGLARAVGHGADALAVLAASPHVARPELTVILDVVADRVLARSEMAFGLDEPDRLAATTAAVLRRNLLPLSVLEPWVARVAAAAGPAGPDVDRAVSVAAANAQAFLRSLHLRLALGPQPPEVRADLLLVVIDALRRTNADLGARGRREAPHRGSRGGPPPLRARRSAVGALAVVRALLAARAALAAGLAHGVLLNPVPVWGVMRVVPATRAMGQSLKQPPPL
jgi:hypothetical protein